MYMNIDDIEFCNCNSSENDKEDLD